MCMCVRVCVCACVCSHLFHSNRIGSSHLRKFRSVAELLPPTSCRSPEAAHRDLSLPSPTWTGLWHPICLLTTCDTKARWFTHTRVNPGHARAARRLTCTHSHAHASRRTRTLRNPGKGPRRPGGAGALGIHPHPPPTAGPFSSLCGSGGLAPPGRMGCGQDPGRGVSTCKVWGRAAPG